MVEFCALSEFEGLRSQKLEERLVFYGKSMDFVMFHKKNETNEVGFRFHELSIGQNVPLDCGYSLGLFLAKQFKKTRGKLRFSLTFPFKVLWKLS